MKPYSWILNYNPKKDLCPQGLQYSLQTRNFFHIFFLTEADRPVPESSLGLQEVSGGATGADYIAKCSGFYYNVSLSPLQLSPTCQNLTKEYKFS